MEQMWKSWHEHVIDDRYTNSAKIYCSTIIYRSPLNVKGAISLLYFKCWITRCEGINATTLYWNKDVGLKQGNNIIK